MLEKEFCTTPTIHEYEFAHYRHQHRLHGAADEDSSSAEPKPGPQLVDLRGRAGALPLGLVPPPPCGTEQQGQRGRSHQASFATEGKASAATGQDRRTPRDSEEPPDSAFRAPGPAGRISPSGVVIEPYYLGDSVTQISPTTYSFSRRRRAVSSGPLSEADLTAVARRSSSTTTFSEEDFQISYHKVLDSSATSWLGEGEDDDVFGSTRSRYRQRRDADSVPSVELPSIRATHKTKSEQLASRGSGVEDVAVQRPRSEDLSVHIRETPRTTLGGHPEASIVGGALGRMYQPSRIDSDRRAIKTRVGFGSSPAGLPQTTQSSVKACSEERGPEATPSPPPPMTPPPPPPRMPPVEKPPRGNHHHHHQSSAGQGVPRSPPAVKPSEPESPSEEKRESGSPPPSILLQGKETATGRSRSRSPRVTRMSSFLQARKVRHELGSGRKTPSPPRSIATDDDNDEIAAAEYKLAIVSTNRATPVVAGTLRNQLDKAVQVHIRTLDKRLVACSVLAGVLAVALVAVVLFALLDR